MKMKTVLHERSSLLLDPNDYPKRLDISNLDLKIKHFKTLDCKENKLKREKI